MRARSCAVVVVLAIVVGWSGTLASGTAVAAPVAGPRVVGPGQQAYGAPYETWAARWAQWAFGTATPDNPIINPDNCGIGQSGQVLFLPPAVGQELEANCTVPAGRALLASPGGTVASTVIGDGTTAAELAAVANAGVSGITAVSASIDGVPVDGLSSFLVTSQVFGLDLPADNLFGVPGPTTSATVIAGYFVVIRPMPVGTHTVTLADSFADGENFDVTLHITVVPHRP